MQVTEAALIDGASPGESTELAALPIAETPMRPKIPQVEKAGLENGVMVVALTAEQSAAAREAFGTTSADFHHYAEKQLLNILLAGREDISSITDDMNALLAMLAGINPQNEMEAMLAAQMVATHHCSMRTLARHSSADDLMRWETFGRMATKQTRTFTMQMEALAKLRRGGKQVVEHVHVNAGGQAVIAGTVNNGRGA